mmetsp:Transcript_1118/g.3321  ORF Transcript_1118/g.3321 Transcript_1118/m.3321 type:complete len:367 (-) Transcript_1118:266-1366(-)
MQGVRPMMDPWLAHRAGQRGPLDEMSLARMHRQGIGGLAAVEVEHKLRTMRRHRGSPVGVGAVGAPGGEVRAGEGGAHGGAAHAPGERLRNRPDSARGLGPLDALEVLQATPDAGDRDLRVVQRHQEPAGVVRPETTVEMQAKQRCHNFAFHDLLDTLWRVCQRGCPLLYIELAEREVIEHLPRQELPHIEKSILRLRLVGLRRAEARVVGPEGVRVVDEEVRLRTVREFEGEQGPQHRWVRNFLAADHGTNALLGHDEVTVTDGLDGLLDQGIPNNAQDLCARHEAAAAISVLRQVLVPRIGPRLVDGAVLQRLTLDAFQPTLHGRPTLVIDVPRVLHSDSVTIDDPVMWNPIGVVCDCVHPANV